MDRFAKIWDDSPLGNVMRVFQWTLHSHVRDFENVKQLSHLMSKWLRRGNWSDADILEGRARRRNCISIDEQGWVPFNELTTLVADFLKKKYPVREEAGHGESFLVLQRKRYHRLLTALVRDSRDTARLELLIEVEGAVFWNIAAAREHSGTRSWWCHRQRTFEGGELKEHLG